MEQTSDLIFDEKLIRRFDVNGPRYTSYPTADRFVDAFDANAYRSWLAQPTFGGIARPLSLYVHVPFCDKVCFYCACNKIITANHRRSADYVRHAGKEMQMLAQALNGRREVAQLHWGGGTPTFLADDEMREVMDSTRHHFSLAPNGEFSIEIDPRTVDVERISLLSEIGFNRMSLGVQDFDPDVQRAVNRVQSHERTRDALLAARAAGFRSVSFDLIYGLPLQSIASFGKTLEQVVALAPDRISLYSYAHLPRLFKSQRQIHVEQLPTSHSKLQILKLAISQLTEAGYVYIGMDHFARPDDELAVARRQGRLHRNFQGYSTHADTDLVGIGVSAISKVGACYSQNFRTLDDYYDAIDSGELPVMRGIELTADDLLRRAIIQSLMCHFELAIESFEIAYLIDFDKYFAAELAALREMRQAGLVDIQPGWISVLPRGRLLVRAIAMVFDKYLRHDRERARYSKVI